MGYLLVLLILQAMIYSGAWTSAGSQGVALVNMIEGVIGCIILGACLIAPTATSDSNYRPNIADRPRIGVAAEKPSRQ